MDAKVTLSFNQAIIQQAKSYAENNGLSLSRLTEILLRKVLNADKNRGIEDIYIEEWVSAVAEGDPEYKTRKPSKKSMKKEFFEKKK